MKVVIIGGGVAGLSAAYELSKKGADVILLEKAPVLGGLASSFPLESSYIERYYHFICLNDFALFSLLKELGIDKRLNWVYTKMGLFYKGKIYPFSRPWDLMRFPYLTFGEKLKFGFGLMDIKRKGVDDWKDIEMRKADEWLKEQFGENIYYILHEPLIRHKFGSYAQKISAAWMWARIHRIGKSRSKILQREILGYIDGGTKTLVDELEKRITSNGGKIRLKERAEKIIHKNGRVCAVQFEKGEIECDAIISTISAPELAEIIPDGDGPYWDKIRKIESIGVVCALLITKESLSENFWLNINDPKINLAGVIEYSNLNPCHFLNGSKVLYMPQYIHSEHPIFKNTKEEIINTYSKYLSRINSRFSEDSIEKAFVFKDKYAQPICETGFSALTPGIKTSIKGLYITDSCQLHPDDRTISNSINLGKKAAEMLSADLM
ncbi:MAG: NAD(P)/FAD-dependent oxidoreductase [Candidatus Schekmanbacteria bacterium]|nr:MAG: NAD(P)/FAD-dependent oxidoreductase [Candidatus Schekmanbacteria bacterium]